MSNCSALMYKKPEVGNCIFTNSCRGGSVLAAHVVASISTFVFVSECCGSWVWWAAFYRLCMCHVDYLRVDVHETVSQYGSLTGPGRGKSRADP
jgi:hypothetical protein